MMKHVSITLLTLLAAVLTSSGQAAWVDGVYWADSVDGWTGLIQNYGWTLMTEETTWWITGPPDADVDGNGYAWDAIDNDTVAGWRSTGSASITVEFIEAIRDVEGNDLVIKKYGGSSASGNVLASSDGISFVQIGTLGTGTPGWFTEDYFDLAGLVDNVHYIKLERVATGPGTGMFFDALGSVAQPPVIESAVSRKTHAGAGIFDVDVFGLDAMESRSQGTTEVVVTFDRAIQRTGGAPDDVQASQGSVESITVSGDTGLEIALSGAEGPEPLTLSFPGIANASDASAVVTDTFCFRVLPGDVDANGVVNLFDLIAVRNEMNQPVVSGNFRSDTNTDGLINLFDLIAVRNAMNTTAEPCS